MNTGRIKRTDLGTVVFHWILFIALLVLLATGLRIAADHRTLAGVDMVDWILPSHELWSRHLLSGVILIGIAVGYMIYIWRAGLYNRIRLDHARLMSLTGTKKTRWQAVNVLLYWLFFGALGVEVVTGVLLFSQAGEPALELHYWAMWICLIFPAVHVLAQAMAGGWAQVLRILNPEPLSASDTGPDITEIVADLMERLEHSERASGSVSGPLATGRGPSLKNKIPGAE